MKFRGFPRRTPCRRLSMNHIARGPKWKLESAARMLGDLGLCMLMCISIVCSHRVRGCHRGVKWESKFETKADARAKKCQFLLFRLFLLSCWNFFSSAFSNLLLDCGIRLVGMCHRVVYMYTHVHVPEKKNPYEMCLSSLGDNTWTRK